MGTYSNFFIDNIYRFIDSKNKKKYLLNICELYKKRIKQGELCEEKVK